MVAISKAETKEIIELSAAASALIGYTSSLTESDINPSYIKRLNEYYIANLEKAVKVFMDKLLDMKD